MFAAHMCPYVLRRFRSPYADDGERLHSLHGPGLCDSRARPPFSPLPPSPRTSRLHAPWRARCAGVALEQRRCRPATDPPPVNPARCSMALLPSMLLLLSPLPLRLLPSYTKINTAAVQTPHGTSRRSPSQLLRHLRAFLVSFVLCSRAEEKAVRSRARPLHLDTHPSEDSSKGQAPTLVSVRLPCLQSRRCAARRRSER